MTGAIHVVQRIRRGLPGLRTPRTYRVLERAFRAGKEREGFRLIHYSVQQDHLHLVVEVEDRRKLARGMQGLAIRIARALNRRWHRRRGNVFAERTFARMLANTKQVWRAIRYVLLNGRKHGTWTVPGRVDPYSSGRWFTRWTIDAPRHRPLRSPPVAQPDEIDLFLGLCRHLHPDDRPGPRSWADVPSLELAL